LNRVNFGSIVKAFDAVIVLRDAARRLKGDAPPPAAEPALTTTAPSTGLTGHLESRLTNVVVAALKEAFDRDHARMELERAQLEEQRRRAEEALRAELRRQAADREVGRLRLLAGTALFGWVASVVIVLVRLEAASTVSRALSAAGWLLLLAALGAAFTAQGRVSASVPNLNGPVEAGAAGAAALWLLVGGLALAAIALLM
jgi:hypothetical protein